MAPDFRLPSKERQRMTRIKTHGRQASRGATLVAASKSAHEMMRCDP
jgi:hypothetical protein